MRSVGVTCTPRVAYLTLAVDGAIAEAPVERIDVAAQCESSEELLSTLDEIKRAMGQLRPDVVGLLMPEQSRHKRTYPEIAPRVALEKWALLSLPAPRQGLGSSGMRSAFL